jgi:hypothetical protein
MARYFKILFTLLVLNGVAACDLEEDFFTTDLRNKSYPEGLDSDGDGLTDVEELAAGLDPDSADTDSDGTDDASDDPDEDGLTNLWEIKLGFDPFDPDSGSSKFGMFYAGNDINDCDEDTDEDFAPNCWEIKYNLDPLDPSDYDKDNDGDGFSNALEYPEYDPNDPDSHPPEEKDLVLYDNVLAVASRTNSTSVRGTARFCFGGDKIIITSTNSEPSKTDDDFVDCTVADYGLSATLGSSTEELQMMYMWRLTSVGTFYPVVLAPITYDVTGPSGASFTYDTNSFTSLTFDHTPATSDDYTSVALRRFTGSTCDVRILRLSATPPYKKKGQHFAGIWYFKIAKN